MSMFNNFFLFHPGSNSLKPFPRYISVNGTSNPLTATIYYLLLYFTGYHFPSSDKCKPSEVCYRITACLKSIGDFLN